ncbi:MAG TPA: lysylphosphatidylglycerol synthase transmembrane domain-containing protein [Thermoanaerobaculia bacterium]|nr:lysylphosphatidylglycerol synthase transmembrane domain-containing protein [Thermoanaerobaculia bacterium]
MKGLLRSPRFQAIASAVLALGLFAYFLSRVPLSQIAARIAAASPAWLAAAVGISLTVFVLRAVRWLWILRPLARVPWFPAFRATAIGFAANTVLPARAGEILRPAILARDQGLPFPALLASIVFERILDAMSQLCYLGIALLLGPAAGATGALSGGRIRWAVAAIAAVAVTVALFAVLWRGATERFLDRLFGVLPDKLRAPARRVAHTFLDGFASLKTPRLAALVGGGSLFMWFAINVQIWCSMRAFGLQLPLPSAFLVTTAGVLGLVVPTPGGVGGYHAAVQYALTDLLHVPLATATGVALVAHAVSFVPISIIGFTLFAASPLSRRGLKALAAEGIPPTGNAGR